MCPNSEQGTCFLAGDSRVNEHPGIVYKNDIGPLKIQNNLVVSTSTSLRYQDSKEFSLLFAIPFKSQKNGFLHIAVRIVRRAITISGTVYK
jgi:hypothetical protein